MPLDGTITRDHPAATLTATERGEAIAYLEWLDAFWDEYGKAAWFQCEESDEPIERVQHCLIAAPGTQEGTQSAMSALGFTDDWQKIDANAPTWNDAKTTTFTMVHTRVKDTLAVLRILEGSDANT